MKKFLIFVFTFWIISSVYLKAYTATGHEGFTEISFVGEGKLLADMTSSELEKGYKEMGKRRFWGWKHFYFSIKEEATYIGEIVFAKTNRSREPLKINYNIKETEFQQRSTKYSSSLTSKFGGTIKKIDASLVADFKGEYGTTSSTTKLEETSFTVVVEPNYKLIFRVTGDALVTNGVSKYFAFGITFSKGSWEYIDVVTRYYELYEEEIS